MTPMEQFADDTRSWARQTIIFTLQYSFPVASTPSEDHAQVVGASDESLEIVNHLWTTAAQRTPGLTQTVRLFVRLVLEWSSDHLPRPESRAHSLN